MDVRLGEQLPGGRDKVVHELVVLFAADPVLLQPEVEVVPEQLLVVGAAVQDHGQRAVRVHAGAERRERQLGARDEDAADALVADAEDLLAVCCGQSV